MEIGIYNYHIRLFSWKLSYKIYYNCKIFNWYEVDHDGVVGCDYGLRSIGNPLEIQCTTFVKIEQKNNW